MKTSPRRFVGLLTLLMVCCAGLPPAWAAGPVYRSGPVSLINEINAVRADPAAYADKLAYVANYVQPGGVLAFPGEVPEPLFDESEWRANLAEAVRTLKATRPLPVLQPDAGLQRTAQRHVNYLADDWVQGDIHQNKKRAWPRERMARNGPVAGLVGENIMFSYRTAFAIVAAWLIEDGVESPIHRKNLLARRYNYAGASCGPKGSPYFLCVVDLAEYAGQSALDFKAGKTRVAKRPNTAADIPGLPSKLKWD